MLIREKDLKHVVGIERNFQQFILIYCFFFIFQNFLIYFLIVFINLFNQKWALVVILIVQKFLFIFVTAKQFKM